MADNALRQGEILKPKTQQDRNVLTYNDLWVMIVCRSSDS